VPVYQASTCEQGTVGTVTEQALTDLAQIQKGTSNIRNGPSLVAQQGTHIKQQLRKEAI